MPHRPVLRNLHHKRALLPLSGAEHQLLRNLHFSDESVRVLDDLLAVSKGMTMRKILFTVFRMVERNLASRASHVPSPAAAERAPTARARPGDGPSADAMAKLDHVLGVGRVADRT